MIIRLRRACASASFSSEHSSSRAGRFLSSLPRQAAGFLYCALPHSAAERHGARDGRTKLGCRSSAQDDEPTSCLDQAHELSHGAKRSTRAAARPLRATLMAALSAAGGAAP